MKLDLRCCCGDICTEFYCSPPPTAESIYRRLYEAAIVVNVEDDGDCNHVNNYIAFDNMEEAKKYAEEAEKQGFNVNIITGKEARQLLEDWLKPAVVNDEEYREILAKRIAEEIRSVRPREHAVRPRLTAVLIDGSGSMEPAWFEAWQTVFDQLRHSDTPFAVLLFKHNKAVTAFERLGAVTTGRYAVVIDVARLLRRQNIVRLPRAPVPEEVGITFRGWTPLLEALVLAMEKLRDNYPTAEITLYVVSDNRDSMIARDNHYREVYGDREVVEAKREHRIRLVLLPVGHYLRRYTEKYDEVRGNGSNASSLLSLI